MSDHTRALWGELRRAVEYARHEHERIARVVWLLWEYRTDTDEWAAMRDYAVRGLSGAEAGTLALDDIVVWMTAEGEQEGESPGAWFRAAWAWTISIDPFSGHHIRCANWSGNDGEWVDRASDHKHGKSTSGHFISKARICNPPSSSIRYSSTARGRSGESWPYHLDTTPIKEFT